VVGCAEVFSDSDEFPIPVESGVFAHSP
jgi:hypothetical protein